MKSRSREVDLSPLTYDKSELAYFYNGLRIQADPSTHQFIVNFLKENSEKGIKILDLGSGNGALPAQLLDNGYDVSSTSWNGRCKIGNQIYELNLDNGFTLKDVGGDVFDMITAVDIIEHVENPWAFVRSCANALSPEGTLIITTPNLASARSRLSMLFKGYSPDFDEQEIKFNRHISPIWNLGFHAMAEQARLNIIDIIGIGNFHNCPLIKRQLFYMIERLLPESSVGRTTIYVLKRSNNKKLDLSADNIY